MLNLWQRQSDCAGTHGSNPGNREMYVKDADGNSIRFIREGSG